MPETTSPLLSVNDLSIGIQPVSPGERKKMHRVVRGVDFKISPGQCVALVGESGSGKSLTARSILGLLPGVASVTSGDIRFCGNSLLDISPRRMRGIRGNRISMIFQEPMNSLNPLHTVEKQVGETLGIHQGMGRAQARERTLELLERVGIDRAEERLSAHPHELSGGQRQRVMLAMALANEPDLLIADEPTTALDVTVARKILDLLAQLKRELNMAILMISHDLSVVENLADEVHVMQAGSLVESGPCHRVLNEPRHAYTQSLVSTGVQVDRTLGHQKTGIPGFGNGENRANEGQLAPVLSARDIRVDFSLKKNWRGRVTQSLTAVDGVGLDLFPGDCLGLVGESGSGKTTLAKALLGLIPFSGRALIQGREMKGLPSKELQALRQRLQIVFQDPFASLNPRMTIGDIVYEGPQHMGKRGTLPPHLPRGRKALVSWALDRVGLSPKLALRWPHELSGGQRQRVAIARAMVMGPDLLILDEPTSSLDRNLQFQILSLLRDLQEEFSLAYLFITHDLKLVKGFCNRVMVMEKGRCVEEGETRRVFSSPATEYSRALIGAAGVMV